MAKKKQIKITQVRSIIKQHYKQKRTIAALGLRKPNDSVTHTDTPQIRGMVARVSHLVKVEEL